MLDAEVRRAKAIGFAGLPKVFWLVSVGLLPADRLKMAYSWALETFVPAEAPRTELSRHLRLPVGAGDGHAPAHLGEHG